MNAGLWLLARSTRLGEGFTGWATYDRLRTPVPDGADPHGCNDDSANPGARHQAADAAAWTGGSTLPPARHEG